MATEIVTTVTDDGVSIKLEITGKEPVYVPKEGLLVDSQDPLVKLFLQQGKSIFFDESNVITPPHTDAADLADIIQNLRDAGGILAAGASTEAKQDTGNASLSSIDGKVSTEVTLAAQKAVMDIIKTNTDRIDVLSSTQATSGKQTISITSTDAITTELQKVPLANSHFLDTVGDGTGSTDGAADFSVTPGSFLFNIPAGVFNFTSIVLFIEDDTAFTAERYGGILAVTNGVEFHVIQDSVENDLLIGMPIQSNGQFTQHGAPFIPVSFGSGNDFVGVLVDIFQLTGSKVVLDSATSDAIRIRLSDDFSGLVKHTFKIFGHFQ